MKNNIQNLLGLKTLTVTQISKDTSIARSTVDDYAKGKSDIGNMKLDHALILNEYYLKEVGIMDVREWIFEEYTVYDEGEVLKFTDKSDNLLGYVSLHDHREEMIEALTFNADPINDGWEDGLGNTISLEGWLID